MTTAATLTIVLPGKLDRWMSRVYFGNCSELRKAQNEVGRGLFCELWEGFFPLDHSRWLVLDDGVWRLDANRFLGCLGVNFFVYLLVFVYWSYIVC